MLPDGVQSRQVVGQVQYPAVGTWSGIRARILLISSEKKGKMSINDQGRDSLTLNCNLKYLYFFRERFPSHD